MKRITAPLLCFLLLCTFSVTAFAEESEGTDTNIVITVTVPDSHKIFVESDGAKVFYKKVSGNEFTVERLSTPRLLIRADSGKAIKTVLLNGVDVTAELDGGYLELAPVYEDKVLSVTTEDKPAETKDSYIVKGRVTLNGQPLAGADIELRSVIKTDKTDKTDKNGSFRFVDVEPGKHSLTALRDGEVIGYLSFTLQKGSKCDLVLQDDGTYTVYFDKNSAGIELHLVLNEEEGTLVPTEAITVQKSSAPKTGDNTHMYLWRILMLVSAACIVVLGAYCRKMQSNKE